MSKLHDLMLYICMHYPAPDDLSNARLTKMLYLADWRAAITSHAQLTDLSWQFDHYGPFLGDVVEEAQRSEQFDVVRTLNAFGSPKVVIAAKEGTPSPVLSNSERDILDHVISQTSRLYFNDFIKLVYSTYPIVSQPRYSKLDLVSLAGQYKELRDGLQVAPDVSGRG